jgi:hypothetical protein
MVLKCNFCKYEKVSSILAFNCDKCKLEKLCNKCRMPEDHKCQFNFREEGRKILEKQNLKVIAHSMKEKL